MGNETCYNILEREVRIMTNAEAIENFKEFIDHFRTQIKQAQAIGDKAFDIERAERDIQTFEMGIKALS